MTTVAPSATMTLLEALDAGVRADLTSVNDVLRLWRSRRWAETTHQRRRIDLVCRVALKRMEAKYPGRVLPHLAYGEARAVELTDCANMD